MFTGQVFAAAQLQYLEDPQLPLERSLRRERDDRVGDGELGGVNRALAAVLANPERRRCDCREATGEIVKKPAEVRLVRGKCAEGFEAVDDDNSRSMLLGHAIDRCQDRFQAAVAQGRPKVFVEDPRTNCFRVEEGHRLPVADDLVERLRDGREIERRTFCCGVMKDVLLAQDGLATPGRADDEIDGVRRQATAEHLVDARAA